MTDSLTILYYSALQRPEAFASKVRQSLLNAIGDLPLISITQGSLDFGTNINVTLPVSTWSVYKQIELGARLAETKFIACAEDDVLYSFGHFQFRPPADDTFYYSRSRWWIEAEGFYRWRKRTVMSTCVCNRELYLEWAKNLFSRFPEPPEKREDMTGFSEPGRYEEYMGLPRVKIDHFTTQNPVVTFNEKPSLGGKRRMADTDIYAQTLPFFGDAKKLWSEFHS